jgi:hypothetical protein
VVVVPETGSGVRVLGLRVPNTDLEQPPFEQDAVDLSLKTPNIWHGLGDETAGATINA